jgi:hypothetical protein
LTIEDENGNVQTLEVTDAHPFWVVTDDPDLERAARSVVDENGVWLYHENIGPTENGFWVEAKDLREGDVLLGANGELVTVVSNERVACPDGVTVYNFTVEGNHNYFVLAQTAELGQTSVLVHNAEYGQPTVSDRYARNPGESDTAWAKRIIDGYINIEREKRKLTDIVLTKNLAKLAILENIIIEAVFLAIAYGVPEAAILAALGDSKHLTALSVLRPHIPGSQPEGRSAQDIYLYLVRSKFDLFLKSFFCYPSSIGSRSFVHGRTHVYNQPHS